jgi:hypothetical protein
MANEDLQEIFGDHFWSKKDQRYDFVAKNPTTPLKMILMVSGLKWEQLTHVDGWKLFNKDSSQQTLNEWLPERIRNPHVKVSEKSLEKGRKKASPQLETDDAEDNIDIQFDADFEIPYEQDPIELEDDQ